MIMHIVSSAMRRGLIPSAATMTKNKNNKMQMKKKTKSRITKKSPIMDAIERYPEITPVLLGYGLHCVGCHFSQFDTIENGAKIHGMSQEDLKMMLKDVNAVISISVK